MDTELHDSIHRILAETNLSEGKVRDLTEWVMARFEGFHILKTATVRPSGWARLVHTLAIEKGWWDFAKNGELLDLELIKNLVPEKVALMHSELSEALQLARQDRWETTWELYEDGRDTPRIVRLSQIKTAIRHAHSNEHSLHFLKQISAGAPIDWTTDTSSDILLKIVEHLSLKAKPEGFCIDLVDGLFRILDLIVALGEDVDLLMAAKQAYNGTRPYRHGRRF